MRRHPRTSASTSKDARRGREDDRIHEVDPGSEWGLRLADALAQVTLEPFQDMRTLSILVVTDGIDSGYDELPGGLAYGRAKKQGNVVYTGNLEGDVENEFLATVLQFSVDQDVDKSLKEYVRSVSQDGRPDYMKEILVQLVKHGHVKVADGKIQNIDLSNVNISNWVGTKILTDLVLYFELLDSRVRNVLKAAAAFSNAFSATDISVALRGAGTSQVFDTVSAIQTLDKFARQEVLKKTDKQHTGDQLYVWNKVYYQQVLIGLQTQKDLRKMRKDALLWRVFKHKERALVSDEAIA